MKTPNLSRKRLLRVLSTSATLVVAISCSYGQINQSWYTAPHGTWNGFDYSMAGAATGGDTFYVIKGVRFGVGTDYRSAVLYQRVGRVGQPGKWVPLGNAGGIGTYDLNLIPPVMTSAGVSIEARHNNHLFWFYDLVWNPSGKYWSAEEAHDHFGPYSRVPGTTLHLGRTSNLFSNIQYFGTSDYALPSTRAPAIGVGAVEMDTCVTGPKDAYVVDVNNNLYHLSDPLGAPVHHLLGAPPFTYWFLTVADHPGGNCYATSTDGDLWIIHGSAGETLDNLERPVIPLGPPTHIYSTAVSFDSGRNHHVVVAVDEGPLNGNGQQQLYGRAYDWAKGWQPWAALPRIPPYFDPVRFTSRQRWVVGSPTIDRSSNQIIIVDNEGRYWRTQRNWNDTSWTGWQDLGRP